MPYARRGRRRPYRRRAPYRRRTIVKPPPSTWGQTVPKYAYHAFKIALKNADKLALLNTEVKRHDTNSGGNTIPQHASGLNPYVVSAIAQGDSASTRDGNSIKCLQLDLRFHITQAATPTDQQLRITVVKLKRAGIASLDSSEIFENPTGSHMAWRNLDKTRNVQVLRDMFIDLNTLRS